MRGQANETEKIYGQKTRPAEKFRAPNIRGPTLALINCGKLRWQKNINARNTNCLHEYGTAGVQKFEYFSLLRRDVYDEHFDRPYHGTGDDSRV